MPYRCSFGCTSYNPCCDACEGMTTDTESFGSKEREHDMMEAAKRGLTVKEYHELEDLDN